MKKLYKALNGVILRRPIFNFKEFKEIPKSTKELSAFVENLFSDRLFAEGVFLASPDLYAEWEKSIKKDNYSISKRKKLHNSILKYYIRSCTNCIPFGMFSSYTVFNNGKRPDEVKLLEDFKFQRYASIDMQYLSALVKELNNNYLIKEGLIFFVNSTLYKLGNEYRYFESKPIGGSKNYCLTSLQSDPVLDAVIEECRSGQSISSLQDFLQTTLEGVSDNEIKSYIEELINSKVLQSNLDIILNGKAPYRQLHEILLKLQQTNTDDAFLSSVCGRFNELIDKINDINSLTEEIDRITLYKSIIDLVRSIGVNFELKYLINVNLKRHFSKGTVDFSEDENRLQKAITVLASFSTKIPFEKYTSFRNLKVFKEAFYERYEERFIPLLEALDNVSGIGYIQSQNHYSSFSPLIEDINYYSTSSKHEVVYSHAQHDRFWIKKFLEATKNNDQIVLLQHTDIKEFVEEQPKLYGTFPIIYKKIGKKISIVSAGGSTALHYAGRFTADDSDMQAFSDEVTQAEELLFPGKILAEVLHLPHDRAGNISIRNVKRGHHITIASPQANEGQVVPLDDIMIGLREGQLILKSLSTGKEIIPFLSSAQNFHSDTLPVYHLLCDLQAQYRPNILSMDFSDIITNHFTFIPRVEYDNIILTPATWNFDTKELNHLLDEGTVNFTAFKKFKSDNRLPDIVNINDINGEALTIDLTNENMICLLETIIKRYKHIQITEFLYDEGLNGFANEHIMSFEGKTYKESPLSEFNEEHLQRAFIPGDKWLYYKIYTGATTADKILINLIGRVVKKLKKQKLIDKWFFLRYNDPHFHLRVRFHFTDDKAKEIILSLIEKELKKFSITKQIWKVELSTYERELERYAGLINESELMFSLDSDTTIKLLEAHYKQGTEDDIWLHTLKCIDDLFEAFSISQEEKLEVMEGFYEDFLSEFNADKTTKKQIDLKYRRYEAKIEQIITGQLSYLDLTDKRRKEMKKIAQMISTGKQEKATGNFLTHHIHMHVNRVIKSNARMHELVLYAFMVKYYRKQVGIQKHYLTNTVLL